LLTNKQQLLSEIVQKAVAFWSQEPTRHSSFFLLFIQFKSSVFISKMDQDWNEVVIKKKNTGKPSSNDEALRNARQSGTQVEAVKKCNLNTKYAPNNA
jgi:hypothetical protein